MLSYLKLGIRLRAEEMAAKSIPLSLLREMIDLIKDSIYKGAGIKKMTIYYKNSFDQYYKFVLMNDDDDSINVMIDRLSKAVKITEETFNEHAKN